MSREYHLVREKALELTKDHDEHVKFSGSPSSYLLLLLHISFAQS